MSEAGARRNLKLMRQFNLNAVRASHYSNDERLYKLGFYLVDGAEPRGGFDKGGSPACRPEGKAGIRDLITRLVARDKSPATTTSEAWAMRMATAQCATRLALG
jgi:beta-galactosidase